MRSMSPPIAQDLRLAREGTERVTTGFREETSESQRVQIGEGGLEGAVKVPDKQVRSWCEGRVLFSVEGFLRNIRLAMCTEKK